MCQFSKMLSNFTSLTSLNISFDAGQPDFDYFIEFNEAEQLEIGEKYSHNAFANNLDLPNLKELRIVHLNYSLSLMWRDYLGDTFRASAPQ